MTRTILIVIGLSAGLTACSSLTRSPHSGYSDDYGFSANPTQDFYREKSRNTVNETKQEMGMMGRNLNENEQFHLKRRLHLKRLEAQLRSSRAKKQYYGLKPFMPNDSDKIYFLKLPTVEARARWAQAKGFSTGQKFSPSVQEVIENADITVGMNKKAVLESWGDPDLIEVAGNPLYGNERWRYKKMISSTDGYSQEIRIIYFEGGLVSGWEKL